MSDHVSAAGPSVHTASHAESGSVPVALFACLYQPPLPHALVVPPVAGRPVVSAGADGHGAAAGARSSAARVDAGAPAPTPGERPVSPLTLVAAEFSPRYEQHRLDLVTVDLRGLSRLFGSPRAIGAEIRRDAASRGLRVHVAIAPTRTAAMVLALTRPGLTVVPRSAVPGALADVPLTVLDQVYDDPPVSGSSRVREQRRVDDARAMSALRGWGVRTLGELAALPAADLSARLGRSGRVWQAIARGDDTRPLVPMQPDERFEAAMELEWPIEGQEPLSFVLTRLLEPLSTRLERRDRGVAILHVTLHLVTREVHQCRLELPSPLREVRALRTLVLLDVDAHPPAAAIDAVTITIEPTPGRILQHALFERPHPTPEQLSTLLARLGALMGQDRVGAPALVDSFRPGAFALEPFALEHRAGTGTVARAGMPTDRVAAVDGQPTSALRRCRQPIPARVATDGQHRPLRVFTDRRGFAGGAVLAWAGPWRTSGAWWEDEDRESQRVVATSLAATGAGDGGAVQPRRTGGGLADARAEGNSEGRSSGGRAAGALPRTWTGRTDGGGRGPWSRDEWDVALADGAVYRVFRDRTTDGWFVDGIVD